MNNIDLSIIVPVFNKSQYIEKCLDSLIIDGYYNYEIILVNDGSTDDSLTKCVLFRDSNPSYNIKVLSHENKGVSHTRNIGLNEAIGQYIMFMDADDYVDTDVLFNAICVMKTIFPDILFSDVKKVDHSGNLIIKNSYPYEGSFEMKDLFNDFFSIQSKTGLYGCVSNKIIKNDLIKANNNCFNTSIKLAEDLDFFLDLYKYANSVFFMGDSYLNYIQNTENSSTSSQLKQAPDYLIQANIIYKEYLLLNDKNVKELDTINYRIGDYVLFYLKENCEREILKNQIDRLMESDFLLILLNKRKELFDKIILKLLVKKKIHILYIVIYFYCCIRDFKKNIRR